jgi:hypothetical protein
MPKLFKGFPTERSVRSHLNFHWCPADPKCRLPMNPAYVCEPHKRALNVSTACMKKKRRGEFYPSLLLQARMKISGFKRPREALRGGGLPAKKRRRLDDSHYRLAKRDRQIVDRMVKRKKRRDHMSTVRQLSVGFQRLDMVDKFTYLGSSVTCDGDEREEIEDRIRKAYTALLDYRSLLCDKRLAPSLRLRLLHAYVTSVLLYGSEAWHIQKSVVRDLFASFEYRIWRRLALPVGTRLDLFSRYLRRKARFIGHLLRLPSQSLLFTQLRLPKTREMIEDHLGIPLERAQGLALRRDVWQRFVCHSFPTT